MISHCPITSKDKEDLDQIISNDPFHKNVLTSDFFMMPGTYTERYDLDGKPVLYVRATKSLRIDLQFVNCDDKRSNAKVMLEKFNELVKQAKASGFTEIYCNTASSKLSDFCVKHLGFIKINDKDVLRKLI